ncbi:MAG: hypothetical protein KDK91_01600, partial [Gammaproteobacteria bacterium]|nr:hypothetical protein [Gammaproteobacteria bacterium]
MDEGSVIDIRAAKPDLTPLQGRDAKVRKIVIGESPTADDPEPIDLPGLPAFESDYRGLTHLYLWRTRALQRLPALPRGQQVIEIRDAPDLTAVKNLPATLESIVIEDCPALNVLPELDGCSWPRLTELSLAGCTGIDPQWIHGLIRAAPVLHHLDLSRCTQVERLPGQLPVGLQRLELNGCAALRGLPVLPVGLHRLGLREASALEAIPDLSGLAALDYLDLAFTRALRGLPELPPTSSEADGGERIRPRSLFLFGSGITQPPASEHGEHPNDNVALSTREYQSDVALIGRGTVRRCKLLLLGNGGAGKTCLALNLNPHYRLDNDYRGSTHGIQLWDWPDYEADTGNANLGVNLHLWDFGGQEIYHSTHRLFVRHGSVFIVLWDPAQDGQQPAPEGAHQDVWQPLRYWLDYIEAECPYQQPLVAVVCSHQGDRWRSDDQTTNHALKAELQARLREQLGDEYVERVPLFVFDSVHDRGEKKALSAWIARSVGQIVQSQGSVVPTHWEIAQDLVEGWLRRQTGHHDQADGSPTDETVPLDERRLGFEQFHTRLREAIDRRLATPDALTSFERLRRHWDQGRFLSEQRVRRVLSFLTHSGWLYWTPALADAQVIIDQPWALALVYACLNRDPDSFVYKRLTEQHGRFSLEDLKQWCTYELDGLGPDDERLLLSFMESLGVCLRLSQRWRVQPAVDDLWISPTHLPPAETLGAALELTSTNASDQVDARQLHRGHWFAILRAVCARYGDSAVYARDACLLRGTSYRWTGEPGEWRARLRFTLDQLDSHGRAKPPGLGGRIDIEFAGPEADERIAELKAFVKAFLPGSERLAADAVARFDQAFIEPGADAKRVFFSYAWDPEEGQGVYTEPVEVLQAALLPYQASGQLGLLRDTLAMRPGDYISRYVAESGAETTDWVVVFSSDRYWRSWYCLMELVSLRRALESQHKRVQDCVLFIEQRSGRFESAADVRGAMDYWRQQSRETLLSRFPPAMHNRSLDPEHLRDQYLSVIDWASGVMGDVLDCRR